MEHKKANTLYPINALSTHRWSPRAFSAQTLEPEQILNLIEAARWAPSAYNEQPWRFVIGLRGDTTFDKILSTMVEFNIAWAKGAAALVLNIYKKTYTHNGKPNTTAAFDLGQAVMAYCLEAEHQSLYTHQIGGFDAEKANALLVNNDDYTALTLTAIGYLGNPKDLPEDLQKAEAQSRSRNDINTLVFTDKLNGANF